MLPVGWSDELGTVCGGCPFRVPRKRRLVLKICSNYSPTKIIFSRYIFSRSNPIDSIQSINQFPVDIQIPPELRCLDGVLWSSKIPPQFRCDWMPRVHSKDVKSSQIEASSLRRVEFLRRWTPTIYNNMYYGHIYIYNL